MDVHPIGGSTKHEKVVLRCLQKTLLKENDIVKVTNALYISNERRKIMSKTLTSVVGEAIYPHLTKPNTKFNPEGVYEVTLRLTAAQKEQLAAEIMDYCKEELHRVALINRVDAKTVKQSRPWKPAVDKNKVEIPGLWDFRLKHNKINGTGDKAFPFTPHIYAADNAVWDMEKEIWTGSKLKVAFVPFVWFTKGELGISLRLSGVQVIKWVTGGNSPEALGFVPEAPLDEAAFDAALKSMGTAKK